MTREEGLRQIDAAEWVKDKDYDLLELHVNDNKGNDILAWLRPRPSYCDRGHIQLNIEGPLDLDHQDSFPRYFFSYEEADRHTRLFLKWRIWKERAVSYDALMESFRLWGLARKTA